MKLKKILTVTLVAMLFLTSCSKSELQNAKPTSTSQTTTFNNDKGGPPPPPANTSSPIFEQNLGPLNPAVLGSYSWSNYFNPNPPFNSTLPYLLEYNASTGEPIITVGFNYLGPVELDELGNQKNPFDGATIEVKLVPCELYGDNATLFDLIPESLRVKDLDGNFNFSSGSGIVYNPATNSYEMGWVLNFTFKKSEGPACYIIKVTLNGQVYYRRISVP